MNGFYQKKAHLQVEELRPLEIYELEFVSDLNEASKPRGDPTGERCPRCEWAFTNFKTDPYCMNCQWDSVENKTN